MTILDQQWKKEKDHASPNQDQPSQLEMHLSCAGVTILIISAAVIGIKILIAIINYTSRKVRSDIRINFPTPSAPYDPQMFDIPLTPISKNPSHSSEINQETTRLNQLLESNMRDRTNSINDAINFNQLMGFDNTEVTQSILEDYLMSAMEMEDTHYNGVNIL